MRQFFVSVLREYSGTDKRGIKAGRFRAEDVVLDAVANADNAASIVNAGDAYSMLVDLGMWLAKPRHRSAQCLVKPGYAPCSCEGSSIVELVDVGIGTNAGNVSLGRRTYHFAVIIHRDALRLAARNYDELSIQCVFGGDEAKTVGKISISTA
jgi:hypothetical protein